MDLHDAWLKGNQPKDDNDYNGEDDDDDDDDEEEEEAEEAEAEGDDEEVAATDQEDEDRGLDDDDGSKKKAASKANKTSLPVAALLKAHAGKKNPKDIIKHSSKNMNPAMGITSSKPKAPKANASPATTPKPSIQTTVVQMFNTKTLSGGSIGSKPSTPSTTLKVKKRKVIEVEDDEDDVEDFGPNSVAKDPESSDDEEVASPKKKDKQKAAPLRERPILVVT